MFPMMGNFHGPGGSFDEGDEFVVLVLFDMLKTINIKRKKVKRIGKDGNCSSIVKSDLVWCMD